MKRIIACMAAALVLAACARQAADTRPTSTQSLVDRGRYLSVIGGCNDCHTGGYLEKTGAVPERERLTGDTLGWQGPWGTT